MKARPTSRFSLHARSLIRWRNATGVPFSSFTWNAAYIANWLKGLQDDKRFIFASHAQRAANHLTGLQQPQRAVG